MLNNPARHPRAGPADSHLLIILNNSKQYLDYHHFEETPVLEKRSS